MPEASLRDRYLSLIDQIVQTTLKGNIRSKEQVYRLLVDGIEPGTGEVFEQCLQERVTSFEQQSTGAADELRRAKAVRSLRAIQTIEGEWQRWQAKNQVNAAIAAIAQQIITAEPAERLSQLLRAIDPNRPHCLTSSQLKQLAMALQQYAALEADSDRHQELQQIAAGIQQGLSAWDGLQDHLVSWIYESGQEIGFANGPAGQTDPWAVWAKHLKQPLLLNVFRVLSLNESVSDCVAGLPTVSLAEWIELAIVLTYIQQGLVNWLDRLIYRAKTSSKLSISTFLAFSIIWSQLARGFEQATHLNVQHRHRFADGAFQLSIQILRTFAQRPDFPLYGGVYASFPGSRLRSLVNYLNEPLKRVEGTQEKARILTLIGSSTRAQGLLEQAKEFHALARESAAEANDRPCEIANLNHLSRTCAMQKNYAEAINYSQRALILSRQSGDRLGEANALVNFGYGEVFQAHAREQSDPETYETAIDYLLQGLKLADQLNDRQSLAYGFNSLGIAYLTLDQPNAACSALTEGLQAAQAAGDLYLQGVDLAYLAEGYYRLQQTPQAIYTAGLAMYYLERIASREWRQPAGLLTILQGQLGDEFTHTLGKLRSEFVAAIGVDGYDYLPTLLEHYRHPNE